MTTLLEPERETAAKFSIDGQEIHVVPAGECTIWLWLGPTESRRQLGVIRWNETKTPFLTLDPTMAAWVDPGSQRADDLVVTAMNIYRAADGLDDEPDSSQSQSSTNFAQARSASAGNASSQPPIGLEQGLPQLELTSHAALHESRPKTPPFPAARAVVSMPHEIPADHTAADVSTSPVTDVPHEPSATAQPETA